MASYSSLPKELIIELWHLLSEPQDLVNFALVSQTTYLCGTPFLETHRQFKNQALEFGRNDSNMDPGLRLQQLLNNSRLTLYVHVLQLKPMSPNPTKSVNFRDFMDLADSAMRASAFVHEREVREWMTEIADGGVDVMLALTLAMLPRIKQLIISGLGQRFPHLSTVVKRLTEVNHPAAKSQIHTIFLSHCRDWERSEDLNMMIHLPTVRHLNMWEEVLDRYCKCRWVPQSSKSKITELDIWDCAFGAGTLPEFLKCFEVIKQFSYRNHKYHDYPYESYHIISDLLAHSGRYLKALTLELGSAFKNFPFVGNFSGFTCLKRLETDSVFLLGPDLAKPESQIYEILPPSIETITFQCHHATGLEPIQSLVTQIPDYKVGYLSHLNEIEFKGTLVDYDTLSDPGGIVPNEMQQRYESVGIKLIIFERPVELWPPSYFMH